MTSALPADKRVKNAESFCYLHFVICKIKKHEGCGEALVFNVPDLVNRMGRAFIVFVVSPVFSYLNLFALQICLLVMINRWEIEYSHTIENGGSSRYLPLSGRYLPLSGSYLPLSGRYLPLSSRYLPLSSRYLPLSSRWDCSA